MKQNLQVEAQETFGMHKYILIAIKYHSTRKSDGKAKEVSFFSFCCIRYGSTVTLHEEREKTVTMQQFN